MDHGVRWMIFVACVNTLLLISWRTVSEVKIKATFACCYDASAKTRQESSLWRKRKLWIWTLRRLDCYYYNCAYYKCAVINVGDALQTSAGTFANNKGTCLVDEGHLFCVCHYSYKERLLQLLAIHSSEIFSFLFKALTSSSETRSNNNN